MKKFKSLLEVNNFIFTDYIDDMGIDFYDHQGYFHMDDNLFCCISILPNKTTNIYNKYLIEIINKKTGLIDSKCFFFNDYINSEKDIQIVKYSNEKEYRFENNSDHIIFFNLLNRIFDYVSIFITKTR